MTIEVLLPSGFRDEHRRIILAYLDRGHAFTRSDWRQAVLAFDLLKNAAILFPGGIRPFPVIFRQQIEDRFADRFIDRLMNAALIQETSTVLWAEAAQEIMPTLAQAGLYRHDLPATRLLVAYCAYWWRSFAQGYALEIEIQRDLDAEGIRYEAHDLRKREERLTPYDIAVLGYAGDIKTSVYFLQAARTRSVPHDFVITRVRDRRSARTLVVFMKPDMWQAIDGDTLLVLLEEIVDTLPHAARIEHQGLQLTVIDYAEWKERVRARQMSEGDAL